METITEKLDMQMSGRLEGAGMNGAAGNILRIDWIRISRWDYASCLGRRRGKRRLLQFSINSLLQRCRRSRRDKDRDEARDSERERKRETEAAADKYKSISFISIILIKLKKNIQGTGTSQAKNKEKYLENEMENVRHVMTSWENRLSSSA